MKYAALHNVDRIPILGLGTWRVGGGMSAERGHDRQTVETLQAAIQMGYTHLDTAEMYGAGHTEELVGQAMRPFRRADLFLTTKVSPSHLDAKSVQASLEGSLRRLGTGYIDLYLIHWPNERIPFSETFRTLNAAVRQGLVRHLGVSNFNLEQLKRAQDAAETPLATNQVPYSLLSREYARNGVLPYCQQAGVLLTAYSPVKGGALRQPLVQEIAARQGISPAQVALHWLIRQPGVITIPMSLDVNHLKENLGALEVDLPPEEIEQLNALR